MADDHNQQPEHRLIAQRRAKLESIRAQGNAFPNNFKPSHQAALLHKDFDAVSKSELEARAVQVAVAGRIITRRVMGKASFITLQDGSGQIQCYIRGDAVGEADYQTFEKLMDIGDLVGIQGQLMETKTGELTISTKVVRLLTKALRPLPDKHSGLADTEMKYRQRYLDLITNEQARKRFILRSKIIAALRDFFLARDFLEVETPIMHPIPGGATARPFVTHHNALDLDMYLRVAPELYLKRLVVGGFERVFELNRNFRNEGLSPRHNPEFTMLELYQAYANYQDLMVLTEQLIAELSETLLGTTRIPYQGQTIDLTPPFPRLGLVQALVKYSGHDEADVSSAEQLTRILKEMGVETDTSWGLGKLQFELFEASVEAKLPGPVFITEHPAEISPLARRNDTHPELADRFELFIAGQEIANGFSELNDPEDQVERFHQQARARAGGDQEAMHFDVDYITALEHGMPPTAGEGIGVDRLVMLLVDAASIRDVLLFPHMRPSANKASG